MSWFIRSRAGIVTAHILIYALAFALAVLLTLYVPVQYVAGFALGMAAHFILHEVRAHRRSWLRDQKIDFANLRYYGDGIVKRDVQ